MKDYNECLGQNGGNDCATGTSTCFNIPGSFYCQCNNGYFGNGTSCFGSFSFFFFCWLYYLYFSNNINNKKIIMNVWDKEVEVIVIHKQHVQILKEVSYVLVILAILVLVLFVLVLFSFFFFPSFLFFFNYNFKWSLSLNIYFNTKTVTAIPSLGEITSNSLSISWASSLGATGYQVAIVDSDWNLVSFSLFLCWSLKLNK